MEGGEIIDGFICKCKNKGGEVIYWTISQLGEVTSWSFCMNSTVNPEGMRLTINTAHHCLTERGILKQQHHGSENFLLRISFSVYP